MSHKRGGSAETRPAVSTSRREIYARRRLVNTASEDTTPRVPSARRTTGPRSRLSPVTETQLARPPPDNFDTGGGPINARLNKRCIRTVILEFYSSDGIVGFKLWLRKLQRQRWMLLEDQGFIPA